MDRSLELKYHQTQNQKQVSDEGSAYAIQQLPGEITDTNHHIINVHIFTLQFSYLHNVVIS